MPLVFGSSDRSAAMKNPFLQFTGTALTALWLAVPAVHAQELRTYSKKSTFEDVKFELNDAVITRGLAIDYTGQINRMLERTGADVGSTKRIYANAEFYMFCSAKYSRAMMEADPANVGFCPYVVFLYEAADKPGEIVVGYRRPPITGNDATRKALADIDALLDGIVKDAVK
jgi:hypothetical protein